ncbi:MAG: hypothetical protein U0797_17490 [Gemmataceae bacterium]
MEPYQLWLLALIAFESILLSFVEAAVGLPPLVVNLSNPQAEAACNLLVSGLGALRHSRDGRVS